MKNVKRISLLLVATLVLSCFVGVSAYADDTLEDEYFIIDTDIIFASVPDEYDFDPYGSYGEDIEFCFYDDEFNSIMFYVYENNKMADGTRSVTDEQAVKFVDDYYCTPWGYVLDKTTVKKTVVNGVSALRVDGKTYYPEDEMTEFYYGLTVYLLATNENIFMIAFDSVEEDVEEGIIKAVMSTVLVNGTYFEGDKLNATHDFSGAPTYEDALLKASNDYDDMSFEELLNEEIPEDIYGIMVVIIVGIFIVPTVIVIALAIVFGLKYKKKNEELDEYKRRFGNVNTNYYNPNPAGYQAYPQAQPMPQPNMAQPYSSNAYGMPNNQAYGNVNLQSPINGANSPIPPAQAPAQPMQMPAPPVNMPTPPVQSPTPPVQPTVNPQSINNLAPELQESRADENK